MSLHDDNARRANGNTVARSSDLHLRGPQHAPMAPCLSLVRFPNQMSTAAPSSSTWPNTRRSRPPIDSWAAGIVDPERRSSTHGHRAFLASVDQRQCDRLLPKQDDGIVSTITSNQWEDGDHDNNSSAGVGACSHDRAHGGSAFQRSGAGSGRGLAYRQDRASVGAPERAIFVDSG